MNLRIKLVFLAAAMTLLWIWRLLVTRARTHPIVLANVALPTNHTILNPYAQFLPTSYKHRSAPVNASYRESFPDAFTGECASTAKQWDTCDAEACLRDDVTRSITTYPLQEPLTTHWNQTTTEYLQQVLKRAWGEDPPMIDFYVRAGCRGATELGYLFRTVALFWPAYLGDLIIVLDWNDKENVDLLVNRQVLKDFSVHVVFEHQPCLPGRLFNQYSYLNLYRQSTAEFVVTIDSDCALHRPVTPDVLFNSQGQLLLPTNTLFQPSQWHKPQMYFTEIDELEWGHVMVSQPIAFKTESFQQFFDYIKVKREGKCYEQLLAEFYVKYQPRLTFYCWMCQLGAYVAHYNKSGYDVLVTNKRPREPYLRYAVHLSYERPRKSTYYAAVRQSVTEGLCFWFGEQVFPAAYCKDVSFVYLSRVMFRYTYFDLASSSNEKDKSNALFEARTRLNAVI